MDSVLSVLEGIVRYLRLIRINDVLDVAIIAFAVYKLIPLIKRTRAGNLIWGVVMFVVALGLCAEAAGCQLYPQPYSGNRRLGIGDPVPAGTAPTAGVCRQPKHQASADLIAGTRKNRLGAGHQSNGGGLHRTVP